MALSHFVFCWPLCAPPFPGFPCLSPSHLFLETHSTCGLIYKDMAFFKMAPSIPPGRGGSTSQTGPSPVCISTWHRSGRCYHLPLDRSLSHLEKPESTVRIMFFDSPVPLTPSSLHSWGTSWSSQGWTNTSHPGSWITSLMGHSMWGLGTMCRTQ